MSGSWSPDAGRACAVIRRGGKGQERWWRPSFQGAKEFCVWIDVVVRGLGPFVGVVGAQPRRARRDHGDYCGRPSHVPKRYGQPVEGGARADTGVGACGVS